MRILPILTLITLLAVGFDARAVDVGDRYTNFAGFTLGSLNLAEVQAKLGLAALVETGDAGEYTASVCYSVSGGVVLFLAGEMDGNAHDLGAIELARSTSRQPCSKWPPGQTQPNLEISSLKLGMTESEYTSMVGGKITKEGNTVYAIFESKREMTEREIQGFPQDMQKSIRAGELQGWYDVVISVDATFEAGKLSQIVVWKTETY